VWLKWTTTFIFNIKQKTPAVNVYKLPCYMVRNTGTGHVWRLNAFRMVMTTMTALRMHHTVAGVCHRNGGHPLLGFEAESCSEISKMAAQGNTSLIQIHIDPCRLGSRWKVLCRAREGESERSGCGVNKLATSGSFKLSRWRPSELNSFVRHKSFLFLFPPH
jgi:hypothetical protein